MRGNTHMVAIILVIAGALVAFGPAHAKDEPFPVDLKPGETFDVCGSGIVLCPARTPICDDPKIAAPVDLPGGLGFKGVGLGTTLCSAASAAGPRQVFRITVH
jgi:hypothetical protein